MAFCKLTGSLLLGNLKKFEITFDEFGFVDSRLWHGESYNPQEFPDRVTMKQNDDDAFQLSVWI